MALPVGPVNSKLAIVLNSSYQRCSYQPFVGTGSQEQGWHHFADDIPNNTLCFFVTTGGGYNVGNGEIFFSKQPTTIRAFYDRGPTYYTVPVTTFDAELGVYTNNTNGLNSGAINPDTQIDIGAWTRLTSQQAHMLADIIKEYSPSGTPYGGEPSGPGGGIGPHEMVYDSIDFPSNPLINAGNTGFASIWVPTLKEVQDLATYMWNVDPTTLVWWKKLVANPLDLILGLYIVPLELTPDGAEDIVIGLINTGINMHYKNNQFVEVDCGSLNLDEYWNAYLDYLPYTKISIFLPYIGVRHISADEVMNRSIHLLYKIDLVSGACVALIKVIGDESEHDREAVLYQFSGMCATQIPVTSIQMGEILRATVSVVVAATSLAVTSTETTAAAFEGSVKSVVNSAANLATSKPDIAHTGAMASAAGLLGIQRPYLIIERPRQAVPEEQQKYTGYPSFITEDLGELNGYTEVEAIHLHVMGCTDDELTEIDELLKKGVIF